MKMDIDEDASEQDAQLRLGKYLKDAYFESLTGAKAEDTPFFELLTEVGEMASRQAADKLNEAYLDGSPPRWDDTFLYAKICMALVSEKFRDTICLELWKSNDLDYNGREIVSSIAPIIVVLLGLPSSMTIVAIPISIMIARRGMNTICEPVTQKARTASELREQRKLNVIALNVLEAQLIAANGKETSRRIQKAIKQKKCEIDFLDTKIK